jgi:glucose/arabinose dehydrogenase
MRSVFKYLGPVAVLALAISLKTGALRAGDGQAPAAPQPQQQGAPPPGQGAGQAGQPAAAPGGRGGGRGGAGAALYTANCAGCHGGTDGTPGRAPSLFDEKWLNGTTDERMTKAIRLGVVNTEMEGFPPTQLTDEQIFQLIAFIRTQTGNLKPKPAFVADADGQIITSEKQTFKIEALTKGVETPWGLAFLPDGRLLITERPGRLRILDKGQLSDPIKGTPAPHVQQDGGYLDVTVHPQYARNGWIYLSYSEVQPGFTPPPAPAPDAAAAQPAPPARGAEAGGAPPAARGGNAAGPGGGGQGRGRGPQIPSNTVIVRGKISKDNTWTDQQVIFRSPTDLYVASGVHFGSRFVWDKDGHLFFSLGERGTMQNAQDLTKPLGKIHRVNDDGTVPKDNPFVNTPGADPTIWSYGHRNPQGFAWDPVSGKLWESEHGPTGGDEVNIIERGHNYGWGVASKGIQGGITKTSEPGMDDPIVYYTPSIGPSGISFYTGSQYPGWKNTSLFVCALVGQQLLRLEISGDKVTHQEVIFNQFGRVHQIVTGPDGYLYVALQNPTGVPGVSLSASTPGMIVRLMPASK